MECSRSTLADSFALIALLALAGCATPPERSSAPASDSSAAVASDDTSDGRRMTWLLAAMAYLDGWQASAAQLDSATVALDSTRDADVASAVVLGKALEQHLVASFEAAARRWPQPTFDARLRALHTARRATLEHYEAFLADGTKDELDLAIEGAQAEKELAAPLLEELRRLAQQ